MNYKMIRYTLGWLLLFEAGFFVLPLLCGLIYTEKESLSFLYSMLIAGAVGGLFVLKKPSDTKLYSKDGFVIVAYSWIVLSLFGALPFVFSGAIPNFVDALFESASGFTTTGATILSAEQIDALANSLKIWRSFTNWIGGMGVLVFIMAFLPLGGAHNMNIMKAESTGPSVSKLVPRVKSTALILYAIYSAFTLLQFVLLLAFGAGVFDAVNIAFSTAGTGGFGIYGDSFASYSPAIQVITTVFMLVFSVNFSCYYLALRGKIKSVFNTELKVFACIVIAAISVISIDTFLSLRENFDSFGEALRHSAFTVASLVSTTGFSTEDFNLWGNLSKTILVLLMFVGGCAGSTAGGIKVSRIVILSKGMAKEIRMLVHPKRVKKISLDGHEIGHEVVRGVNSYIICYATLFLISLFLISIDGYDLTTNFTTITATLNNVGPGLEMVGPSSNFAFWSWHSKIVLIFNMIAGRLEIFPMMVLFYHRTYRK